jgi:membrane fusion protein (multidrug efflux system)
MGNSSRLVVIASLAALAGLAAAAYLLNRVPPQPPDTGSEAGSAVVQEVVVETALVELADMSEDVTAVGTLKSNESVVLRPEIAGRISAILFRDGSSVNKGAVVVRLDASTQQAELAQARANLQLAETNYRRSEDLFRRKFVSGSARDEAAAKLEVARAAVALAEASSRKTLIQTPFSGVLGIRNVSVGHYVEEGDTLVNLEDIAALKVDFRLPELYLDRLRRGQTLTVTSDALPGRSFEARVDAIDPLVDAQGRALLLRARLDNGEQLLRPGMFVRVRLILEARPAVPVIAEEALMPAGDGQSVFVVREGRAHRVAVEIGARRGTRVEVRQGLAPGDQVVTAGQLKLRDGSTVRVDEGAQRRAAGPS